ncbi:helix-turn-helix domain-containing protein [Paenibacillus daejeonensis]|uniref:helix-turn-helix domain-containing protein n=1 Tax=Paenibacillus daejeonensis TaxID=135193 RepID=UPI00037A4D34|nr:helix-turn-helix domain-containing protein [Paenibacillus daejeonensis]
MKTRSWFNRLLFTYLPIFYLSAGVLVFIFLMVINQLMERQMTDMSESYGKYVTQQIESSLQNIEQLMITEIHNNPEIKQYVYGMEDEMNNRFMLERSLFKNFNFYLIDFPLIDSIYIVRFADNRVLSTSVSAPLHEFGDRSFIEPKLEGAIPLEWSGIRPFKVFPGDQNEYAVVSLAKSISLGSQTRGILVANVSVAAIQKMVRGMNTLNVSSTSIYDQNGVALFESTQDSGTMLASVNSHYTNWNIQTGVQDKVNYSIVSSLKEVWTVIGLASLVLFTGLMIYFARRYTYPIDRMMNSIKKYLKSKPDELPDILHEHPEYMDRAVHHLIDVANQISDVNKENVLHRQKQFFVDLIGGKVVEEHEKDIEWIRELMGYSKFHIGVVMIDRYDEFCSVYPVRDQYLLKYVMSNVAQEVAKTYEVPMVVEWLDSGRMTLLFKLKEQDHPAEKMVASICETLREWIKNNLDYAVSIGIGASASTITDVARSFKEAEEALSYKKSVGGNRVIAYWELEGNVFAGMYEQLQSIRDLAESFKRRDMEWQIHFERLMDTVQGKYFHHHDMVNLLNFMLFHISKEVSDLPLSYREIWESAMGELSKELEVFDSVSQLRSTIEAILSATIEQMNKLRQGRNSQELLQEVKVYIEQHYSNPELSLQLLSDQFQMNQSYLSRLFKEAYSENFVDYVTRVRMDRARYLLTHTDEQIQHISQQVGYAHYFSFNRMFKRVSGVTPGEFRKQFTSSQQEIK